MIHYCRSSGSINVGNRCDCAEEPVVETLPLARFICLDDESNTQVFTFLILPCILCGTVSHAESTPFRYAEYEWIIRLQRGSSHLGVHLELVMPRLEERKMSSLSDANDSKLDKPVVKGSVRVDFQFTLKNQENFLNNETFKRVNIQFNGDRIKHGRKHFVELSSISSKRFLFDEGKCIMELELANPQSTYTFNCLHSDVESARKTSQTQTVLTLTRLDGNLVHFERELHLESQLFLFSGYFWQINLYIEIKNIEISRKYLSNSSINHVPNLSVKVDISLIRTKAEHQMKLSGSRLNTLRHRVKCCINLPGSFKTGIMEFCIGSHGWPLKPHSLDLADSCDEFVQFLPDCKNTTEHKKVSGSVISFLLACVSKFTMVFDVIAVNEFTLVSLPVFKNSSTPPKAVAVLDNKYMGWAIRSNLRGRLFRIDMWGNSIGLNCSRKQSANYFLGVRSAGCRIQILPLQANDRSSVKALGNAVLELLATHEPEKQVTADVSKRPAMMQKHVIETTHEVTMDILASDVSQENTCSAL